MAYLLNDRELRAVAFLDAKYEAEFGGKPHSNPDLVYFLGDNPQWSVSWSAYSGRVPTFRTNDGFYWYPAFKRMMVARDKLSALCMPVCPFFCDQLGTPVLGIRDPKRASQLAGNCMNFLNITLVQFVALSCFARR